MARRLRVVSNERVTVSRRRRERRRAGRSAGGQVERLQRFVFVDVADRGQVDGRRQRRRHDKRHGTFTHAGGAAEGGHGGTDVAWTDARRRAAALISRLLLLLLVAV